ncbi:unnamed protein product [Paramecium pentaurelia]|uniref:Uncharacterized protein n=1 Tax=Paramecium pentaurelia TaxID=43138 RepID=A0A8S1XLG4_9CILI|nr:unnamed protein product [Paramecium pentaurelia]
MEKQKLLCCKQFLRQQLQAKLQLQQKIMKSLTNYKKLHEIVEEKRYINNLILKSSSNVTYLLL